ncbi:MAG: TIGR02281 family clan AA aspartic protease [Kangiellaceae bacterium]|nr:TIGR02281 family clan AA aspartic protease [Kangiellaceae bacterium]
MSEQQHDQKDTTQSMGKWMGIIGWLFAIYILTLFFDDQLQQQENPNRQPESSRATDYVEVVLQRNKFGHYVVDGFINNRPVTFMLDTGATTVAVPSDVADQIGLKRGRSYRTQTANGYGTSYDTVIDSLSIGDIMVDDIRGGIGSNMPGGQVLLGMSVLKQIEFTQRGNKLILRQYYD